MVTKAKTAWSLSLVAMMGMLTLFGYYTYNGTVIHGSPESSNKTFIRPSIRIEETFSGGERTVTAMLTVQNGGMTRLRLINTVAMSPLIEIQLRKRVEGGEAMELVPPTPQNMASMRSAAAGKANYDPETDTVVDLIPGSALTRPIPLSALYDMKSDGRYELLVSYNPEIVIKNNSDAALLSAYAQRLQFSMGFELPMKKGDAPTEKKAPDAGKDAPKKIETPVNAAPAIQKAPEAAPEKP